jgi:hypothetical protein
MTDRIDRAIAQAETPAPTGVGVAVRLSTGRTVKVQVPLDLTPVETVDLIGYLATQLPAQLAAAAKPRHAPRLVRAPAGALPEIRRT